jgi:hypothetical protein
LPDVHSPSHCEGGTVAAATAAPARSRRRCGSRRSHSGSARRAARSLPGRAENRNLVCATLRLRTSLRAASLGLHGQAGVGVLVRTPKSSPPCASAILFRPRPENSPSRSFSMGSRPLVSIWHFSALCVVSNLSPQGGAKRTLGPHRGRIFARKFTIAPDIASRKFLLRWPKFKAQSSPKFGGRPCEDAISLQELLD